MSTIVGVHSGLSRPGLFAAYGFLGNDRVCLDSLTGILWWDDSQVLRLGANKDYGTPGVVIWVERAAPEAEAELTEGEVDAVDALSIQRAERSAGKDCESEDCFGGFPGGNGLSDGKA